MLSQLGKSYGLLDQAEKPCEKRSLVNWFLVRSYCGLKHNSWLGKQCAGIHDSLYFQGRPMGCSKNVNLALTGENRFVLAHRDVILN